MKSALLGRMKVGKCLETESGGYMGCQQNVIHQMDNLCSGKNRCSLQKVVKRDFSVEDTDDACPEWLFQYLQVNYECIRGT